MRRLTLGHSVVVLAVAAAVTITFVWPPIPQDPAYHRMADERNGFGIPNFLNVVSNLPFAVVGVWGLRIIFRGRPRGTQQSFIHPFERWPYAALFAGTALTALGSSYYHVAPDNPRLVWDRLPMAIGFMGLLTAMIIERASFGVGRRLFVPLLVLGAGSVLYWYWSELNGTGDLRAYALVQFGSLFVVVLLLALYPPRYSGTGYLYAALAAYAAAKGFEATDQRIFATLHVVSGHTLKHLAAGAGLACLLPMLETRKRLSSSPSPR